MTFPNPFRAAGALWRVIKSLFKREEVFVTQEESDRRWEICNSCPEQDKDLKQCKVCTCFLSLKTELASERCPLRKW